MRTRISIYTFFILLLSISSCIPTSTPTTEQYVYVWTDKAETELDNIYWYANGENLGKAFTVKEDHSCSDSLLTSFVLTVDETSMISVGDQENQNLQLVELTLKQSANGIKIKRFNNAIIHLDDFSKDTCTQIYLSW